jgi:site-specific DNA recombinase
MSIAETDQTTNEAFVPHVLTAQPRHIAPVEVEEEVIDVSDGARAADAAPGTRAVIYLRVSSKGQVNTDYDPEGISIPAQRVSCEKKADQLGLTIIHEYIEPGRSATEMTKRIAFQEMLARVRRDKDIDYIIVYKLSRFARNRNDDAIVMADLTKRGVGLISATESIDETPVGQLMHGILAAFNEYRSREDGADISYKMGQKAKNGGTLGRAPLGYLNTIERFEGREVRSVALDEKRAPFVTLAFELYASGDHTLDDIASELTDRGLIMQGNVRRAPGPISVPKVAQLLRDRYYLGKVTFKGEEYEGRHPQLIPDELFERVQSLLATRGTAGERRRVNPHYLKGTLYCGRCRLEGQIIKRLILQRAIGRQGNEYYYFFCRGVQDHICDAPYSNIDRVEAAIEEHYKSLRFTPEFIATVRAGMESALADTEAAQRLLRKQLEDQLISLDTKEENLLDFAADGTLPQGKIRARLADIGRQREKLRNELDTVTDDLSEGAAFLEANLKLLEDPHTLYLNASDEIRRKLNQAIFKHIFVANEEVVGDEVNSPLAELLAAQHGFRARSTGLNEDDSLEQAIAELVRRSAPTTRATPKGGSSAAILENLLTGIYLDTDCSKPSMVEPRRIELLTSCLQSRRSTN